jgi:hypothetical protein
MRLELTAVLAGQALCLAALVMSVPSPAAALEACRVGQRVIAPGQRPATVTAVSGTGCTVRRDFDGLSDTYAAFMLDDATPAGQGATPPQGRQPRQSPAPGAARTASATGGPAPGTYQCTSSTAGNLVVRFLPGNRYADRRNVAGRYTINQRGQISFVDGPLSGMYGRVLDGGRLGLTADPAGSFYAMTCDRRG